jgi:hypothetical protein
MKKNRLLGMTALAFAVITAFAGQAFTSPKAITYYRNLNCTGATFTPTTICTNSTSQFCYSQNDGSGCVNLYKN